MNFEAQETALLNQLKTYVNDNANIVFGLTPETEKEFETLRLKDKPVLAICYQYSDYEGARSTDFISQNETETFEVLIRANKLRGKYGIYYLQDLARRALTGFSLPGCTPCYLLKFGVYERKTDTEWIWKMPFAFRTSFAQVDFRTPAPPLTSLTFNPNPLITDDIVIT